MELNEKEKKVLKAFPVTGEPIALDELARAAFPGVGVKSSTRGNSWARNSLRKLVRHKTVKQVGRGLYVLASLPPVKPKAKKKAKPEPVNHAPAQVSAVAESLAQL